jgi:hypothetical protein
MYQNPEKMIKYFPFVSSLPVSVAVKQLIDMTIEPLLTFTCIQSFNSQDRKQLHGEMWAYIRIPTLSNMNAN